MEPLKVTSTEKGKVLHLHLAGKIDEDAEFPKFDSKFTELVIDWSEVKGINSCGIREWLKWIGSIPSTASIRYVNCSRIIVNQINMVDGFLPRSARVESYYVPYYCEPCESITSVLFSAKSGSPGVRISEPPQTTHCDVCKKPAEIDIIASNYFRFLKGAF